MSGLKVKLEVFEGPLDLLLYLIKKEELDIHNIPITRITEQYLSYLELMETLDLDIAGDFIVMTATLMLIKSKMLLPPDPLEQELQEADPRSELVRRLLEYKAFKEAAESLQRFEEQRSRVFTRMDARPDIQMDDLSFLNISIFDLMTAFSNVLKNLPAVSEHEVSKDEFSVADKIDWLTQKLFVAPRLRFSTLFKNAKTKNEVIVTFLALLELIRQKAIVARQEMPFEDIEIIHKDHVQPHEI